MSYKEIHGWFNAPFLYDRIVNTVKDNSHIVEVGAWKGKSAYYMCQQIKKSGKKIKFDVVDTWIGTLHEKRHARDPDVVAGTLMEAFLKNMKPWEGMYTPIRATSVEAAALFEDDSLDAVFVDGDHTYPAVKADIEAWLPKLKKGGILCGDDYNYHEVRNAVNFYFINGLKVEDGVPSSHVKIWSIVK